MQPDVGGVAESITETGSAAAPSADAVIASTPEPTPAPLWRRIAAGIYDLLPALALVFIGTAAAMVIAYIVHPAERIDLVLRHGWPKVLLQIWLLLLLTGYYAWSWHRGGQTIGMKAWRLELLAADGGRLDLGRSVLRLYLSWLSLGLLGAGFIWALNDRHRRTWHDLVARSLMVHKPKDSSRPTNR